MFPARVKFIRLKRVLFSLVTYRRFKHKDCIVSDDRMVDDELERIWRKAVVSSIYYHSIFLEGLRKTIINLSQDSRCHDRHSNRAPTECKPRTLPLDRTACYY
jgi:hypothetical protein